MARVLFKVINTFFAIIFLFAAAMITFENHATYQAIKDEQATEFSDPQYYEESGLSNIEDLESAIHQYHDMLYYMFVTLSTVGFGDICPRTKIGKAMFVLAWLVMILLLQKQISEYSKVNSLSSEYSRVNYPKKDGEVKHILLLGDSQPDAVNYFLKECFHADHGTNDTDVVIMRSEPPTEEFNQILKNPNFDSRVFYM